ncbi:MAG: hypothetical protein A3I78_08805 [Gammaproteobacteria bacterium RIFCSPLOWO2_02_FULL_56_15]|nr:MAG: hypothetical protein A3I78_08805 [Gammaproteobacteria bacterium RIFCSPLOWO2_02_FULL_56_15]
MAALMVLALASGCASVKYTVREASGALNAIATLSQTGDEDVPERIYTAEEQILDACGTLLDSAFIVSVGDHLPLLSWVKVLYSSKNCRQVVADARLELEATNLLASDKDHPGGDLAMNVQ